VAAYQAGGPTGPPGQAARWPSPPLVDQTREQFCRRTSEIQTCSRFGQSLKTFLVGQWGPQHSVRSLTAPTTSVSIFTAICCLLVDGDHSDLAVAVVAIASGC